jgi:OPA family glycerol-3-phosphate transporter-like MFS transporter
MKLKPSVKNAISLGVLCSVAYLSVYFARNILSAVTPQMVASGEFTNEYIGKISSVYFVCYAVGQLVNGWLGDRIKSRYMVAIGLSMAGVTNLVFVYAAPNPLLAPLVYGATGVFLSMIYGPLCKVVSENVEQKYVQRCHLGYTFASFVASPMAGVCAAFLSWQGVFITGSSFLFLMAVLVFASFLFFERKGVIEYGKFRMAREEKKGLNGIRILIKRDIVRFAVIAMITGIVRTSVVFWLPTYFSQYLGYSPETSALIFTVVTFIISFTAFVAVFVYEKVMKFHMERTILLMFSLSTAFFLLQFFVRSPILNIGLMLLAIMASNASAVMLFTRYCPSLYDTGMVSTATGFLDALGYLAAAISSTLFANAATSIGWRPLILVWTGLVFCGALIILPYKKWFGKRHIDQK